MAHQFSRWSFLLALGLAHVVILNYLYLYRTNMYELTQFNWNTNREFKTNPECLSDHAVCLFVCQYFPNLSFCIQFHLFRAYISFLLGLVGSDFTNTLPVANCKNCQIKSTFFKSQKSFHIISEFFSVVRSIEAKQFSLFRTDISLSFALINIYWNSLLILSQLHRLQKCLLLAVHFFICLHPDKYITVKHYYIVKTIISHYLFSFYLTLILEETNGK